MNVLIEFYDSEEPILNVVSAMALHPDVVVYVGSDIIRKQRHQRSLQNTLKMSGVNAQLRFVPVNLYDYQDVFTALNLLLDEYQFDSCTLDVSGGNDLLLLAAGQCCYERNVDVISQRVGSNRIVRLCGRNVGEEIPYDIRLTVAQAFTMAGGSLIRHGHVKEGSLDDELLAIISNVYQVYNANRQKWPYFVKYLQQLVYPEYWVSGPTDIRAPKRIYVGGQPVTVDLSILGDLAEAGAVEDIRVNSTECTFRFCNSRIGEYLKDVGIWLELHIYASMLNSGLFDDVDVNAVISWDDDDDKTDTINEIDVLATSGIGRLFISCKTATPDNAALNEIATLARRFGGKYAAPVLATMVDLKTEAPSVYRRAVEMGIVVIDADDLSPTALSGKLKNLSTRWNR